MPENRTSPLPWHRDPYVLSAAALVLIAALLRLYNLGGTSLWFDEAVYANNAKGDFATFLHNTWTNNSSPILLPLVFYLFQDGLTSAFAVRLPSVAFGTAAVAVMLALPAAGLPRPIAFIGAALMAFSPTQIIYAQEVREYSLSVLLSAGLLFVLIAYFRRPGGPPRVLAFLLFFITPLSAYGACFMALACLCVMGAAAWWDRARVMGFVAPAAGLFGLGCALSYLLTVRYQVGVLQSSYLEKYYPPPDFGDTVVWTLQSIALYFAFPFGISAHVLIFLLLFALGAVVFVAKAVARDWTKPQAFLSDHFLPLTLLVLLGGSVLAALLGLYPFGGIRQHIFAAPLLMLCAAGLLWGAAQAGPLSRFSPTKAVLPAAFVSVVFVAAGMVPGYPVAYRENMNVLGAINEGLADGPPSCVYLYAYDVPVADFYYPGAAFLRGTLNSGDGAGSSAGGIVEEIRGHVKSAVRCPALGVVMSKMGEMDDDILAALADDSDLRILEDKIFFGARLVTVGHTDGP